MHFWKDKEVILKDVLDKTGILYSSHIRGPVRMAWTKVIRHDGGEGTDLNAFLTSKDPVIHMESKETEEEWKKSLIVE